MKSQIKAKKVHGTAVEISALKTEYHISSVSTRHWGPDDDYQVIETQVFDIPAGVPVRVTIQPLTQEEVRAYYEGKIDAAGNPKGKVKKKK